MNVLGLIASLADPASRLRIMQYQPYLKTHHIRLASTYFSPTKDASPAAWTKTVQKMAGVNPWRTWNVLQNIARLPLLAQQFHYDLIWQSRLLLPYLLQDHKLIKRPVVLDLDDAIWTFEKVGPTGKALAAAAEVFAGNEYLADWSKQYNNRITLVPTTVDVQRFQPTPHMPQRFTIGWVGTSPNLKYLHLVHSHITAFLQKHNNARFVVITDKQPHFIKADNEKIIFKRWQAETEVADINEFSVGIMPLADDEWTRGKCGAKLLQYMACGKPVIASPVGFNKQLLAHPVGFAATTRQEWAWAFEKLYNEPQAAAALGLAGRALIENRYSTERWATTIAQRFHQLR